MLGYLWYRCVCTVGVTNYCKQHPTDNVRIGATTAREAMTDHALVVLYVPTVELSIPD